jgi:hypothetical protein
MKRIILCLAALSLSSSALAMSTTQNIPTSNQPVDPADLAGFVGYHNAFMACQFAAGTFAAMTGDPRYAPMMKDYLAATRAGQVGVDNRLKFLEFRSKTAAGQTALSVTFGCPSELPKLSTER